MSGTMNSVIGANINHRLLELLAPETWSLNKSMDRSIDGAYTKLLRYALDVSWRDHAFNGGKVADEGSGEGRVVKVSGGA